MRGSRLAAAVAAALLLAQGALATRQPWASDISKKDGKSVPFTLFDMLHSVCPTTYPYCARSAGGFAVDNCVTEVHTPCDWDVFAQPDAKDKFYAVMRCMRGQALAGDTSVSNKGLTCAQLFGIIEDGLIIPPGGPAPSAPMGQSEAGDKCRGAAGKGSCKKAIPSSVGSCKFKKGKCKIAKYYPGRCTRLKRRDCKKAVKGGACVAAAGGKCTDK